MSAKTNKHQNQHYLVYTYQEYAKTLGIKFRQKFKIHQRYAADIEAAAYLGLVEAANRYDSSQEVSFKAYSFYRIRGAVIDYIRKSQIISRGAYKALKTISTLENDLPTAVTASSSANEEQKRRQKLTEVLKAAAKSALIYQLHGKENDFYCRNKPAEEDLSQTFERRQLLTQAIGTLSQREQLLIQLYYIEDYSFEEIGERLGNLQKSWVSRIHARALTKLQKAILFNEVK